MTTSHDLAQQSTRLTNRLRDALLHVHPALERLLGKHIDRGGVIDLLAAAGTPGVFPFSRTLYYAAFVGCMSNTDSYSSGLR